MNEGVVGPEGFEPPSDDYRSSALPLSYGPVIEENGAAGRA